MDKKVFLEKLLLLHPKENPKVISRVLNIVDDIIGIEIFRPKRITNEVIQKILMYNDCSSSNTISTRKRILVSMVEVVNSDNKYDYIIDRIKNFDICLHIVNSNDAMRNYFRDITSCINYIDYIFSQSVTNYDSKISDSNRIKLVFSLAWLGIPTSDIQSLTTNDIIKNDESYLIKIGNQTVIASGKHKEILDNMLELSKFQGIGKVQKKQKYAESEHLLKRCSADNTSIYAKLIKILNDTIKELGENKYITIDLIHRCGLFEDLYRNKFNPESVYTGFDGSLPLRPDRLPKLERELYRKWINTFYSK